MFYYHCNKGYASYPLVTWDWPGPACVIAPDVLLLRSEVFMVLPTSAESELSDIIQGSKVEDKIKYLYG
jgi:hypothetical protein